MHFECNGNANYHDLFSNLIMVRYFSMIPVDKKIHDLIHLESTGQGRENTFYISFINNIAHFMAHCDNLPHAM